MAMGTLAGDALAAQPPVGLGTADSFAVLAGSTVTNTGPSTINGDLGVSPGTAVTGFPPGTVNGTIHASDAVAIQAQADLTTAYDDAAGRIPAVAVSGDLGGSILTAGVYKSGSTLGLTGTLTLDAQGDPNAVFIFQVGSSLTTASGSRVALINGAQSCNVFWQIGSSATLGTSSVFRGNLLALTSITVNNGVTLDGRALARNGAVTLDNDTITAARCAATSTGPPTVGGTPPMTPAGDGGPGATGAQNGAALLTTAPRSVGLLISQFGTGRCIHRAFRVVVSGRSIRRVVFSVGERVLATVGMAPFGALVRPGAGGLRTVIARVTFTDGTPPATLRLRYRACAAVKRQVPSRRPRGPGGFTG